MKRVFKVLLVTIFIGLFSTTFAQEIDKDAQNKKIWAFSTEADKRFSISHSRLEFNLKSDEKDVKEIYFFSTNENKIEKLYFERVEGDNKASETFYFNKGKLVMIYEDQQTRNGNDWNDRWSLSITMHDGKILDQVSNGSGKTEDDNWEPKPFEMSKKRLEKLKEHINSLSL